MGMLGTELRRICTWAAVALVVAVPEHLVAEEHSTDLTLANVGLMQEVCVGPYAIEFSSVDAEIDEHYLARPLTFGEGWAQANKLLFGKAESLPSTQMIRYAYEPELFWIEWQKNYLEDEETDYIQSWMKAGEEENIDAPLAIVEYAGDKNWWQPKRYIGKYLPIVEAGFVVSEPNEAPGHGAADPALGIIQSTLDPNLQLQVDYQKLLGWREVFCILGSLSHNKGLIGLTEAYGEVEPYKIFIVNSEDGGDER